MRVCLIANPNSIHTLRWAQKLRQRGHEVHLIGYQRPQKAVPDGIAFYDLTAGLNVRKLRFVAWAAAVRRLVRRIRPDVLHAHQVAAAGWLGAASGYHPLVISAWGSDLLIGPRRSRVQRWLARWVLRRADYVLCVSAGLAEAARSLGADPRRLETVSWDVDTEVFYPAAGAQEIEALRARFGLGRGPVVLSLRAMRPIYRPLDLARAIPRVLEQVPEAQFAVRTYGQDPDVLAQFQAIVGEHGAAGAVRYVPPQPDDREIAALNRAADVGVSIPISDGTPVSVLEAMACGTSLVLSDLPSLHEWVIGGREALYVPVGDVPALADAIVRLLQDPALRAGLRDNGLRLIGERANSQMWLARVEEIYRRLCASAS